MPPFYSMDRTLLRGSGKVNLSSYSIVKDLATWDKPIDKLDSLQSIGKLSRVVLENYLRIKPVPRGDARLRNKSFLHVFG